MTSCAIIISHFHSLPFLHACVRSIRNNVHPEIKSEIIICDQSDEETYKEIADKYFNEEGITVVWCKPLYSGYGLDYILRYVPIETDYICQLHADVIIINRNFLYLSIKLIEEYNLSFVGQLQFINSKENLASIYPPHEFFAMAQCFNVAKTSTYKEMSLEAGFTRFHNRKDSGLTFLNDDWDKWAVTDYSARGSDDDVVAFAWEDKHREHNKLGLAISGFCEPSWGRIIDDVIFHFCSCREAQGVMSSMPELYQHYTKKINENYSDELISEMVELAKKNKPPEMEILTRNFWDGKLKKSFPPTEALNKRIEELKNI